MKKLILLLFLFFGPLTSQTQEDFQKGVEAFNNKNYQDAIVLFEEQFSGSGGNSALYFNLGTAYLESKNIAKARLNLERALLLDPFNPSIQNNLNIAIERVETTIIPLEDFFLKRWWLTFQSLLSPTAWSILSMVLLILSTIGVYLLWFKDYQKSGLIKTSTIFGIILVLIFLAAGVSRYENTINPSTAVCMKTSKLRSSPSVKSEIISTLSPGVKIKIKESINEWTKVNTMDLEEGWILSSDIEQI